MMIIEDLGRGEGRNDPFVIGVNMEEAQRFLEDMIIPSHLQNELFLPASNCNCSDSHSHTQIAFDWTKA